MIFVIVVVITIVSLFGCVCIKKPAVRLGLEIIVVLGLMLAVLIGSVTYTTRYRVNFVDSYKAGEGISPSMTRIFSMLVCNYSA